MKGFKNQEGRNCKKVNLCYSRWSWRTSRCRNLWNFRPTYDRLCSTGETQEKVVITVLTSYLNSKKNWINCALFVNFHDNDHCLFLKFIFWPDTLKIKISLHVRNIRKIRKKGVCGNRITWPMNALRFCISTIIIRHFTFFVFFFFSLLLQSLMFAKIQGTVLLTLW